MFAKTQSRRFGTSVNIPVNALFSASTEAIALNVYPLTAWGTYRALHNPLFRIHRNGYTIWAFLSLLKGRAIQQSSYIYAVTRKICGYCHESLDVGSSSCLPCGDKIGKRHRGARNRHFSIVEVKLLRVPDIPRDESAVTPLETLDRQ